jgi:hypothetical protein
MSPLYALHLADERIGRAGFPLRLNPRFRWSLYTVFAFMFVTGVAWLGADQLKGAAGEDFWQATAAWLLMLHGGAAMVTLLLLGALMPLHANRAWRSKKNRATGAGMVTFNIALIATSFGLYYIAGDSVRPWMSSIHIAAGCGLPVFLLVHIANGRRARSR